MSLSIPTQPAAQSGAVRKTAQSQPARKSIFISLGWKMIILFTVLFSLVFALAFRWFYQFAEDMALRRIEDDLVSTLQGGAAGVKVDELLSLNADGKANAAGFSDDSRYIGQLDWLDIIHKLEPRAWPYVYVLGSKPNEVIVLADLWTRYDPSRSFKFKESYISKGSMFKGLNDLTLRTTNGKFTTYADKWGQWVSAYTPIKNNKGEIVAAMGIDFEANYVESVRKSIRDSVVVAFVVTYAALFLLVFLISQAITRPIRRLTRIAERIGDGIYNQDLKDVKQGRLRDEIGALADVFGIMVAKVDQREQTLRRQVEELKIEIDEAKSHRQINEIVDTDFFRDLQSKAGEMRRKRFAPGSKEQSLTTKGAK